MPLGGALIRCETHDGLDLPHLKRLEAAGRAQLAAKGKKILRRECFHDAELLHGQAKDLVHAAQMMHHIGNGFLFHPRGRHLIARQTQFSEHELEPQLEHLMHHNKVQFVLRELRIIAF